MAKVTVSWDDEAKIAIRFEVHAGCVWGDFWEGVQAAYRMMGEVSHTVDLFILPDPGATPPVRALANFRNAQERQPDNFGIVALIGGGMYAELLFSAFSKVYRHLSNDMIFVASLEKARAELAQRRVSGLAPEPGPGGVSTP